MKKNEPNYTLDDKMISLVAEITEIPTHLEMRESAIDPLLRKKNRLKTIHSSLAIEHNSLTVGTNSRKFESVKISYCAG